MALRFTATGALPAVRHINFDESACLMANNVWNEVVTIHTSQEAVKMLFLYTRTSFAINCFVKNTGATILLAPTAHQTPTFTGLTGTSQVRCGFCEYQ
jgi:hypothetical protein